jgi:sec-independent protein translocase protein TatA
MRDLLQPMHLLIIVLVFMVLFGGKKLADVGKGLGEGIRNFKTSLKGDEPPAAPPPTEEKKQA